MGPFKCPECGVWWAGIEHRCRPNPPSADTFTVRPWSPDSGTGSTSTAPWCGICQGWHIPGAGACTRTYSLFPSTTLNLIADGTGPTRRGVS